MKIDTQKSTYDTIAPGARMDVSNNVSSNICDLDNVINSSSELYSVTPQAESKHKISSSVISSVCISDSSKKIKLILSPTLEKMPCSADIPVGRSYEADSLPDINSRKFSRNFRIRGVNRKSINHQVSIVSTGDFRAERLLFPENGIHLSQSVLDATEYERAIARLPSEQITALRTWTMVNDDNDFYSDGTLNLSAQGINPVNYGLNLSLMHGLELSDYEKSLYNNIISALKNDSIPMQKGSFLRMAEYLDDDIIPWYSIIKPGDVVTNNPAFMSVSSSDKYAKDALSWPATTNNKTSAIVIYKIENAFKLKPLLADAVSTLRHEEEYLYLPESYFIVKGISIGEMANKPTRIGVILSEIDRPENNMIAKNIFNGKIVNRT